MKKQDFSFTLPQSLIAKEPAQQRDKSRLLRIEQAGLKDMVFSDIASQFEPGDMLVLNDTKVMPARTYWQKASGGKVELFITQVIDDDTVMALCQSNKALKTGAELISQDSEQDYCQLIEKSEQLWKIKRHAHSQHKNWWSIMEAHGKMPLPPYIKREATDADKSTYQTVFAKNLGAVAAPTAGLHFTKPLLDKLKQKGVIIDTITLHVGLGTFMPMRVDNVKDHVMHKEWCQVSQTLADKIKQCKTSGKRLTAVGTTVCRTLESAAAKTGEIQAFEGETDIFITPGFAFKCLDRLLTNFHLPESTLMMLVCAFGGQDRMMQAYQHAINQQYRFYSYGDAMLIDRD